MILKTKFESKHVLTDTFKMKTTHYLQQKHLAQTVTFTKTKIFKICVLIDYIDDNRQILSAS